MQQIYTKIENSKIWFRQYARVAFLLAGSILRLIKNRQWCNLKKQNKKLKKKNKRARQKTALLEHRLLNLGFTERAEADLLKMFNNESKPHYRKPAARVLARWYANQHNQDAAKRCLEMLDILTKDETRPKIQRQAAVMASECHCLLGDAEAGRNKILQALTAGKNATLYLAMANFESAISDRIKWVNRALNLYNLSAISCDPTSGLAPYDRLKPVNPRMDNAKPSLEDMPLITVIMPAYNAETVIRTALDSILTQSWTNLEVLVVDDCSRDTTASIVEDYCHRDHRVRLIKAVDNSGPYVARNLALQEAKGHFVTCHDADDWSHPQKLAIQAEHLLSNPEIVGNISQLARTSSDLKFHRAGRYNLVVKNISSFMFRREPVIEAAGFWDCVRFGADTEFVRRNEKLFGVKAISILSAGPLSFVRKHANSLTSSEPFGCSGYHVGARREYLESMNHYLQTATNLRFEFPQNDRPFMAPDPMLVKQTATEPGRRHFDVILASDFRLPGGTTTSNIEEIKAQKQLGLRTGLIQMPRYSISSTLSINPKIREIVDGDQVQIIVYGEKVSCDCLIIKHPPILQEKQRFVPDVTANRIIVIINQTPFNSYEPNVKKVYDFSQCQKHIREYFGPEDRWYPIGPRIREILHRYHTEELSSIELAEEDWVEIINVTEWRRKHKPVKGKHIRIGRHSRDDLFKWPHEPAELLAAYPEDENYEIHILGGAENPKKILGRLPHNWQVLPPGSESAKDFLARLDVFVYFTHPNMIEAFGRLIIEAMAVGVPVILPPSFNSLFGEAAIYAEPSKVKDNIERLMSNDDYYLAQVEKAQNFVGKHFSYQSHAERLKALSVSI